MIHLYTGKTGGGKTNLLMRHVYREWRKGKDVYTNTKVFYEKYGGDAGTNIIDNPENFTIWERCVEFIASNWADIARKPERRPKHRGHISYYDDITELIEVQDGIIILDEAQNLFDSRNWENLPLEFANKLRQHRKHNLDLYATTQNMGTIDINMRRLVQKWYHMKDIFALFWIRNPSLLSIHMVEIKDVDRLTNVVDDLLVPTLRVKYFLIYKWQKRLYDTMYDIGFNAYKTLWLENNKKRVALIMPKNWTLSNARTQSLLLKYYLDQTNLNPLRTNWKTLGKNTYETSE